MFSSNIFLEQVNKMSRHNQKKLISNIFEREVLVFSIDDINEKICIKFYDGNIYYQFTFISNVVNNDDCFEIKIKDRICVCNIFINNISLNNVNDNNFYEFIKILKEGEFNCLNQFLEED